MIYYLFIVITLLASIEGKSQSYAIKNIRTHFKDEVNFGIKWRTDVQNVLGKGTISLNQQNHTITIKSTDGNIISYFRYNKKNAELDPRTGFYLIHACSRVDISETRPNGIPESYGIVVNSLDFSSLRYLGTMSNDYAGGGLSLVMYYFIIQTAPF